MVAPSETREISATMPPPRARVRLQTPIFIRWLAIGGQFITVLTVHFGLDFELPIVPALIVVAASASLNLLASFGQPLGLRLRERTAAAYLAFDILQLSILLFLMGGLHNPFALLILAPVTVSAAVLSRLSTVGLGVLAGVCLTVLSFWHLPFPWRGEIFTLPRIYILAIWLALGIGVVFIASYVGSISAEARRMSSALSATQMALAREQRLSALGALAAAAAHELGSPLSTIAVTVTEMAKDVPKKSPLAEDVALLKAQAERCRDILARLGQEAEEDGHSPFLRLPISALAAAAAERHRSPDIRIDFDSDGDGDGGAEPAVPRSPEIIHGLGNLIQNAVQFARVAVTVRTRWSADDVAITIIDDGPGFPPRLLDRIGEPYISSRIGDGHMGLGIFIAQTLLERTGAELKFSNHEGGAAIAVRWKRLTLEERLERGTNGS